MLIMGSERFQISALVAGKSQWKRPDPLLFLLLDPESYLDKSLMINNLEARGVEPLSSRPSHQISTCLAGQYRAGLAGQRAPLALAPTKYFSSSGAVAPPSGQPAVVASGLSRRPAGNVTA